MGGPVSAGRQFVVATVAEYWVREQELVMVGEMPVERSAQLILLLLAWTGGVGLRYGSTADQGRTGREDSSSPLWCPARALGTHAKQGPSTGHSAVGLRQAGKMSPDAEATFHRASCTLGNQVVVASDGTPFRQERRPTRVCRTPGAGSGLLTEASTLRAGRSCPGWRPGGPGRPRIGRCRCVTTTMTGCAKHVPHRLHRRLPVHARQIEFGVTIAYYPRPTTTHRSITDARNPAELCLHRVL
jgi:hypothetical protein